MEDKKRKRTTLILLALLALLIGLLIPLTWRSFMAVKASITGDSSLANKASATEVEEFSGSSMKGGYLPSSTPTTRRTSTSTATLPPSPTATSTATIPPSPTVTHTSTQPPKLTETPMLTETSTPTTTPSSPPTVGPGGDPREYSTAGLVFGLIAIAAFVLYFSGAVVTRRKSD